MSANYLMAIAQYDSNAEAYTYDHIYAFSYVRENRLQEVHGLNLIHLRFGITKKKTDMKLGIRRQLVIIRIL